MSRPVLPKPPDYDWRAPQKAGLGRAIDETRKALTVTIPNLAYRLKADLDDAHRKHGGGGGW